MTQSPAPVIFAYGFGVAFVAAALLTIVWRYEPNPFLGGFLMALLPAFSQSFRS